MSSLHRPPERDTNPDEAYARHVAAFLSASVHDLDDDLARRLRDARQKALAAYHPRHAVVRRLLALGSHVVAVGPALRQTLAMVAVLVLVFVGDYWSTSAMLDEMTEIDAALLADELPIDAYLDSDFPSWLRQDSSS